MKISVIGKTRAVTHWLEDCVAGLIDAGHQVQVLSSRDPRLSPSIDRLLLSSALGAPRAAWIARAVQRFQPDLILAMAGYDFSPEILQRLHALPGRAPLVAWIGDAFADNARQMAQYFDHVFYIDSQFVAAHQALGLTPPCSYLPHAANLRLGAPDNTPRAARLVFVGNPTPQREALLGALRVPVELVGPGWKPFRAVDHVLVQRRIGIDELAQAYRSHVGVLNIRHERNVSAGLNQRSFDPYLLATPVVSDAQPDLVACFAEGAEVLVYRSADELDDIAARLAREPEMAQRIGEAGRARVLAEHGYRHRIAQIAAAVL